MTTVEGPLRLAASLCLVVLAVGCGLLDAVPGPQLDLAGTTWQVVELDGEPLDRILNPLIHFPSGPTREDVVVDTGCREVAVGYALDTDGSALGFAAPSSTAPPCPPHLQGRDEAIFAALRDTESWAVVSNDVIEFRGRHVLRLERVATDYAPTQ